MCGGGLAKDNVDVSIEDMEVYRMKRHMAADPIGSSLLNSDEILDYESW